MDGFQIAPLARRAVVGMNQVGKFNPAGMREFIRRIAGQCACPVADQFNGPVGIVAAAVDHPGQVAEERGKAALAFEQVRGALVHGEGQHARLGLDSVQDVQQAHEQQTAAEPDQHQHQPGGAGLRLFPRHAQFPAAIAHHDGHRLSPGEVRRFAEEHMALIVLQSQGNARIQNVARVLDQWADLKYPLYMANRPVIAIQRGTDHHRQIPLHHLYRIAHGGAPLLDRLAQKRRAGPTIYIQPDSLLVARERVKVPQHAVRVAIGITLGSGGELHQGFGKAVESGKIREFARGQHEGLQGLDRHDPLTHAQLQVQRGIRLLPDQPPVIALLGLAPGKDVQQDQRDETEYPHGHQNARHTSRFGDGFCLSRSCQPDIRQPVQLAPLPLGEPVYHTL